MSLVKFSDVVQRANTKEDKDNTDKIYYVGGEHIDSNNVLITERGIIKGSTIGPMFYFGFKAGQVLFVSRNPHLRKAGMVTFDGICSEKTFVLETKDESILLQRFLPFVMQSNHFWNYMEAHKSGSVNYFINWSTLANYEFELPDIDEQKRLTELLWAIKDTKYAYEKLISSIDEVVKSQFIEMFKEVEQGELSDVSMITMGQSPSGKTYNTEGEGVPFYQGKTDFGDLYIGAPTTWTTAPTRYAEYDDVLMSVRAPVGSTNLATEHCCLGRGLAGIRPIEGKSTSLFILYSMRSIESQIEAMGVGSTFKAINKDQVYRLPIPLAPLSLQEQFVELAEQSDKSKFEIKQCIETTEKLLHRIIDESIN